MKLALIITGSISIVLAMVLFLWWYRERKNMNWNKTKADNYDGFNPKHLWYRFKSSILGYSCLIIMIMSISFVMVGAS